MPRRSPALLIMPLALWLTLGAMGQRSAVDSSGNGAATPAGAAKLYESAGGAESAKIAEPGSPSAAVSPAALTLPPSPRRVRDLPDLRPADRVRPFRAAAFGLTASSLGAGAELAVPIARRVNLRVGGSYLNFAYPFTLDGIDYRPGLKFTAGQGTLDWFPHHGAFHISAGALYFRNRIAGSATVSEGQSFTLGETQYTNSVDDPVGGNASVTYGRQIAPLVLLGFGNVLPRSGRHLSVPIEFGGAYLQPPQLHLQLSGTACTSQGCFNAATDAQVQANLKAEVNRLEGDLHLLQVYPIVSLGIACRF